MLNRAASESEIDLDKIIKDRDSVVSILGFAYFTMKQLQADNQTLRERNSRLERSVDELIASQDDTKMKMTAREEALDRESERGERIEAKGKEVEKQLPDIRNEPPRKETAQESTSRHKRQATRSRSISLQSSIANDSDITRDLTYLSIVSVSPFPFMFELLLLIRRLYS